MSDEKKRRPRNDSALSPEDAQTFRNLTRRTLKQLKLSVEEFAGLIGCEPRTLWRYLSPERPLYDSQAQTIREGLVDQVQGEKEQLRLFRRLYSLNSPAFRMAVSAMLEWCESAKHQSAQEREQLERALFSKLLVSRLVRDGQISKARQVPIYEAISGILEEVKIKFEPIRLGQLSKLARGPETRAEERS